MSIFGRDTFTGASIELSLHSGEVGMPWAQWSDGANSTASTLKTDGLGRVTDLNFLGSYGLYNIAGTPTLPKEYTIRVSWRWNSVMPGILIRATPSNTIRLQPFTIDPEHPSLFLFSATDGLSQQGDYAGFAPDAGSRVLLEVKVSDAGGGQLRYQMSMGLYGQALTQYINATNNLTYADTNVKVGILTGGGGVQFDDFIAYDNSLPLTSGEIIVERRFPTAVDLRITAPPAYTGTPSYQLQRTVTSGTGYINIGTASAVPVFADTGLTPGATYYYRVVQTAGNGTVTSAEVAVRTPVASTFQDGFAGPRIWADVGQTTDKTTGLSNSGQWIAYSGAIVKILGGKGVWNPLTIPFSPLMGQITPANADMVFEVELEQLTSTNNIAIGIMGDPVTGDGYRFLVGQIGFTNTSALLTLPGGRQIQGGDTGNSSTALNGLRGSVLKVKITCTSTLAGRSILCEYKSGANNWVTFHSGALSDAEAGVAPGLPMVSSNGGTITYATLTYDADPTPADPGGADIIGVGNSETQFPAASLGGANISHAVGAMMVSNGIFRRVRVFNCGWSTIDTEAYKSGDQIAHAVALIQYWGIKYGYNHLGVNDAGNGTARSKAAYKANQQVINAALLAAGLRRLDLIDPTYTTNAGYTVSLLPQYGAANGELAAANPNQITSTNTIYTYTFDNPTTAVLSSDGLHYPNGSEGAPGARDRIYAAILPQVQLAYPAAVPSNVDYSDSGFVRATVALVGASGGTLSLPSGSRRALAISVSLVDDTTGKPVSPRDVPIWMALTAVGNIGDISSIVWRRASLLPNGNAAIPIGPGTENVIGPGDYQILVSFTGPPRNGMFVLPSTLTVT